MRVLIISSDAGCGELDIALRAQQGGHQVRWFFNRTEKNKWTGKGLVERVDDFRPWMRWADLVILADNTKYLREIDAWRSREGIKVIGATQAAADWELNRTLGQKVLKQAGVDVLPYKEFSDYDTAIAYVKRENRRLVSKPLGDEKDKSLSYVAKSPEDLVYMLERWKRAQRLKGAFMLQDFVPGVEMAVGGWFGPGGFNQGFCENWEEKNIMAGGTGPNCGEMGTTLRYVRKSKLADKVLKPVEDQLYDIGYCGYVDVNCIIDEEGNAWPLEFTMRFGWPTFNIQQALLDGDVIEWLALLANGQDGKQQQLQQLALGTLMALPDFPYSKMTRKEVVGVPVYGITDKNRDSIHPCEMMQGEAPQALNGKITTAPMMVSAGDYLLVTTGTGDTVTAARKACHRAMKQLKAPSSPFWRPDIGVRLKKELPILQAKGYALGMQY